MVSAAVLSQSKHVPITAVRPVNIAVPKTKLTIPKQFKPIVTKTGSPTRRHINRSPSPKASNSSPRVTTVTAPVGNPQHALKDKGVIDSGCSRHITGNMSYLSDFKELNGGYVAFGGNPKGGKISRKECLVLSPKFKLPDESQVLLRVPRENNMYNGIKREFSVPRTPQQNGIAERKNIKAARTMLADSLLPIPFCRTRIVQETLHVNFLENKPNVAGSGPTWLFDIDTLTETMNYQPVTTGNQSNPSACVQENLDAEKAREEIEQQYVLFPVWSSGFTNPQNTDGDAAFDEKEPEFDAKKPESEVNVSLRSSAQSKKHDDNTKREAKGNGHVDAAGPSNVAASPTHGKSSCIDASQLPDDPDMLELEDITYFDDEDDVGAGADFNNLETSIIVRPIPTTRVHKDHHVTQIIGDLSLATQTRKEPKRVHQALKDLSWIKAMNKKDKRGIVVRNKVGLFAQGHTEEEGINYKEVFAPVARIEAIRLFLAYASSMGFMVYQMDVKSADLYGTIEEEVYVCQPPGFEDPDYPDKVYKVVKALYGLHQAPRAWYETLSNYLLENGFQRGKIDQTLFIKRQKDDILLVRIYVDDNIYEQKEEGIFISQDKYVPKILRKFRLTDGKSASRSIDTGKPLLKDSDGEDVDVHTYRSMIGSLMYLTSSRPDIMFAVCACARIQVTPKASHLHVVKRIFRYLKGKPHLGLWYLKDSPFDLVAYLDSDYAGASPDRKSTTGGYQFLRCRLISWQCKKQTAMATSSTEAEYVAAAS
nr:hypothetical protein [Tanacetum cinerariifolium]